jgi:hypothetical protein
MGLFDSGYSELPRSITPKFDHLAPKIPELTSNISASGVSNLITRHPLCDENLLKDIDGLASMSSLPSIPNLEDVLSASGLSGIPKKLDPKAMFNGVPEFTGLQDILGIPDLDDIDYEKEAKALADDVLSQLNITNPLADLCGQVQGAGADLQDQLSQTEINKGVNNLMPNIDVPKFTDIVDIPEVGDLF